ncbi:sugar phosphate isomerase/epimerase [Paraglaciecola aquimarina]|uniref:Sugar phosphate isomerase/epimerase n=1 Tax=Paraglaciecola algarum TaxID=3050085 RepID=A0ABS9DAW0_9ALTE|nr:TIM barrel protein [Paraglaciecola sp. G1-23]MCF2950069.1 sugar phosphate isomerase/epimerase [Paraglaciecola sp. G1-23]
MQRREFIQSSTALALGALLASQSIYANTPQTNNSQLNLNVFSKHLQFLNYADMADAAANIGFDGVDLTVRPKGHVLPERVTEDLSRAVEGLKSANFSPNMMTTAITDVHQQDSKAVISTAGQLGFKVYRMGYYRFNQDSKPPQALKEFNQKLKELAVINKQANIKGAYQNHAGVSFVGAQVWDIWHMLEDVDTEYMGCQYDIRHASVEGAQSWPVTFNMLRNNINSLVLKDYKWQKVNSKWKLKNVPIGQGMVDFKGYFAILKSLDINLPVSMHFEYDLGGAEHGAKKIAGNGADVFAAMQRDVEQVRLLWQQA